MTKILALCIVFFAEIANADVMFKFKDGTVNVWESYYENNTQYCTQKSFGEYCVLKKDVISIKEVPAGTVASEYSMSSVGIDQTRMDGMREETVKAQKSLNCTQLKAANKTNTNAYRNDCYTPEQKAAWNEQVKRNNEAANRAFEQSQQNARDMQRDIKEQQRDQKIDRIDRTLRGY